MVQNRLKMSEGVGRRGDDVQNEVTQSGGRGGWGGGGGSEGRGWGE